jgi:hypothetical protein
MRSVLASELALLLVLVGSAAPAAPADPAAALPAVTELAPLVRAGDVERHTPESLWERIDGEAELYKAHGLTASAHALYEDPAVPDRRVELSVFSFADPLGAFGLFAAFRPPDCVVHPLGNGGCSGDYQGFFWHGDLFVLADAAGSAASRPADLRRALASAAALLGPPPPRPEPLRAFSRFVDTRTIRHQPHHVLGREALPPGLEGQVGGQTVFLSVGPSNAESVAAALDAYAGILAGVVRGERNGYRVLTGRDPALGPVVLLGSGRGISGARSVPENGGLLDLLEIINAHGGEQDSEGIW